MLLQKSYRMYLVRWRYWSKTKIIAQECTWWGEGIDPKHFVSLFYVSVAIKASLLKFSMFSVHKNTITNIFLEFSNFKIVGLVQIGEGIDPNLFVSSCTRWGEDLGKCFIWNGWEVNVLQTSVLVSIKHVKSQKLNFIIRPKNSKLWPF